jgi:AraC family transcriptional regulator, transcriptional activator of pobA
MARSHESGLYDPRRGDLPLRIEAVALGAGAEEPARTNYFAAYWIQAGAGRFWADAAVHTFDAPSLLFFVPYQHIRFEPATDVVGEMIQFHANYLCVETFHAEIGCSGVLFNDPYGAPIVRLDGRTNEEVGGLIDRMRQEQAERGLAHNEALLAYLKVLLILATRLKTTGDGGCNDGAQRHPAIGDLRELIEQHYCRLHAPSAYAELLHMSPKTLGRIVREQLGKTLTDLIQERILTHAKWQLLHTLRPVKEIAREVGFRDELYFSRLFKKWTGYSPTFFREYETEIRGGSNLSMLSGRAPIQGAVERPDNSDV